MKLLTTDEKAIALQKLNQNSYHPGNGCWLFKKGTSTNRYGQLRINYRLYLTHRLSAAIFLGLDLDNDKLQVNHKLECTSAFCWNPEHLYIGTQAENMKDVSVKSRDANRICDHCGHLRTFVSTTSRGKHITRLECDNCRKLRYRKSKNG